MRRISIKRVQLQIVVCILSGMLGDVAVCHAQSPASSHSTLRGAVQDQGQRVNAALGFPLNAGTDQLSSVLFELTALEVSTAPYGTSAGGFTYTFDADLGTFARSTTTFGPSFAERSLTIGKHKLSIGANFLHATYNSLAGQSVNNVVLAKNGLDPFGPVVGASEQLTQSSESTIIVANYGLANNLDVGVAMPWTRVSIGSAVYLLSASGADLTGGRPITLPNSTAAGVGDIALIAKYRLWHNDSDGVAAGLTVFLPTGDPDQELGIGVTRTLISAIWSRSTRISPHVNVGYEFWSAAVPISPVNNVNTRNEIKYAAGFEMGIRPRLTLNLDVVGRRLQGGGALDYEKVAFNTPLPSSADELLAVPKGFSVLSVVPGFKWNVAGNGLIVGNVLVSVVNNGFRANYTPTLGFDWTF